MSNSISLVAEKIGILKRRRAELNSTLAAALQPAEPGSVDSGSAAAALSELEQVESELAELEDEFSRLRHRV